MKILVASERQGRNRRIYDGFLPCAIDFIGHAFWPLSQGWSIKNCCCETNIWRPRIATRTGATEDIRQNRSSGSEGGEGKSGLGVPAHLGSTLESRPSNRSRHGSQHSGEEWH